MGASLAEASQFLAASGLRITEASGRRVRGDIDVGPDQHTPWGIVHGGVYCAAVETAASLGASLAVADRGMVAVGLANTTNFLQAMRSGKLAVEARPIYQGRTHQLWDVSITREDGRPVAAGQVRLQNVPAAGL